MEISKEILDQYRSHFLSTRDPDLIQEFVDNLPYHLKKALKYNPKVFLQSFQIPPDTNWKFHLFRGGRGIGKSFASTSWLYEKIISGAKECAIVCATYSDFLKDIKPVFESHFLQDEIPTYNSMSHQYETKISYRLDKKKCKIKIYSSDQEIRGANIEYVICEEICKWCDCIPEKISSRFNTLVFGVRAKEGIKTQYFISSTPKPFKWFIDFQKEIDKENPIYSQITGSTLDNVFLSDEFKKTVTSMFKGTGFGRQEIYGDLVLEVQGALWNESMIQKQKISIQDYRRITKNLDILKTVVSIDPSVSHTDQSDETGIIVAQHLSDNNAYIIDDYSGKYSPDQWAKESVDAFNRYKADCFIAEKNNGGDLIASNIRTIFRNAPIHLVHAKKGKITRAEPISHLYIQNKVFHVESFPNCYEKLEYQMINYNGDLKCKSPDRLDAMVYALSHLLLNKSYAIRDLENLGDN